MRLIVGLVVASLFGAGAVGAVAANPRGDGLAQAGDDATAVACWNKGRPGGGSKPVLRVEPRRCSFFERGESSDLAAVHAKSIDWKRWGPRKAVGRGKAVTDVVGNTPIKIRLSLSKSDCDARVFSKGKFVAPEVDRKNGIRLYTC